MTSSSGEHERHDDPSDISDRPPAWLEIKHQRTINIHFYIHSCYRPSKTSLIISDWCSSTVKSVTGFCLKSFCSHYLSRLSHSAPQIHLVLLNVTQLFLSHAFIFATAGDWNMWRRCHEIRTTTWHVLQILAESSVTLILCSESSLVKKQPGLESKLCVKA